MGEQDRKGGRGKSGTKGTESPSFPTLLFCVALRLYLCHPQANGNSRIWSCVLQTGKVKITKLALSSPSHL